MKSAIFMIGKGCNQRCRFCLNDFDDGKELSLEEKKEVIDWLRKNQVETLCISGGEPFLNKDLFNIIEYAEGMNIIIQTNGTLLNESILRRLKGKAALEVSLEGLEKEHNCLVGKLSFNKVVKNIKLANELGVTVFTNLTITKINKDCVEDYVSLLESLEVKAASFTRLYMSGRAIANHKELMPSEEDYGRFLNSIYNIQDRTKVVLNVQAGFKESKLREHKIKNYSTCSIGKEITINPDGKLRLCPSLNKDFGEAVRTDLSQLETIVPEDGCMVNILRCTG
ncbi:MAG: radical SAM protein [Nanoarchaeota archaeon]